MTSLFSSMVVDEGIWEIVYSLNLEMLLGRLQLLLQLEVKNKLIKKFYNKDWYNFV